MRAAIAAELALPQIYDDRAHLAECRRAYGKALERLASAVPAAVGDMEVADKG